MPQNSSTEKRAPKAASLTPISENGKWKVNVPASQSPTGKRQRLKFSTKKKAELQIERIKGMSKRWGSESTKISAALAEDAAKAFSMLTGYDISLSATAAHWLEWKKAYEASCSFAELWTEHTAIKLKTVSDAYAKDFEKYGSPILEEIGSVQVSDLTPLQLENAMEKRFSTARQLANAKRTIRPAFSFAVRRGYCAQNPFKRILVAKLPSPDICVLSLPQVKAAFNACIDQRKTKRISKSYQLDCSACIPAIALMLFAGVRPKEMERLQWEAIHFDHEVVTIGKEVAKTRSMRNIPMEDNLRDWLLLTPKDERTGSIVPINWKEKIKAIRHIAGFSEMQDVLRHSFASYHIAAFKDMNDLQASMGHNTPEMILEHYRTPVKKQDAIKFWSLRPNSTTTRIEESQKYELYDKSVS